MSYAIVQTMKLTLGDRLMFYRRRARLSQAELAHDLGVARSTISMWEQGQAQIPSAQLAPICRSLDITPHMLLGWEDADDEVDCEALIV